MVEVCSTKIPSSQLPPSFYYFNNITKEYTPTLVEVQLVLNSLIIVDDIQSTYTIDYFWRILWDVSSSTFLANDVQYTASL